jgi:hypothetical protein
VAPTLYPTRPCQRRIHSGPEVSTYAAGNTSTRRNSHISISATTVAGYFIKARNKEERKAVINAYFVQPLVRKNSPKKQQVSTNPHYRKFRDLIINWRLAPKNFEGSKPHGGLGSLSFITRTLAEQENLEFYRTLNSLADKPTTADIEKKHTGYPQNPG